MSENKNGEIVLCKMFSGNYWEDENNIGYESINMFLPDKSQGESYIYLPANGDYDLKRNIKKIILTQKYSGKQNELCVKILGVAEITESLLQKALDETKDAYICIDGGREFDTMVAIYKTLPKDVSNSSEITEDQIKTICKELNVSYPKTEKDRFSVAVQIAIKDNESDYTLSGVAKALDKNKADEAKKEVNSWRKSIGKNELKNVSSNHIEEYLNAHKNVNCTKNINKSLTLEDFKQAIFGKYKKAKVLAGIYEKQSKYVKEKNITYNKVSLPELFAKNSSFGTLNILTTLKIDNLKLIRNKNVYLTNNKNKFSYLSNEKDMAFYIESKELSSSSQVTYIDLNNFSATELSSNKEYNIEDFIRSITEKENKAGKLLLKDFEKGFEPSFLTRIKKEYDELSYSNLFAYFFSTSPNLVKYFFDNVKDINGNSLNIKIDDYNNLSTKFKLEISDEDWKKYETKSCDVKREERNIDIIIESKEPSKIFVIENKIKSALNGHEDEDINGNKYHEQLVRYYKYIKEKYDKVKDEDKCYLIFAPNYNPINRENLGSFKDDNTKDIEMKNFWKIIPYSSIAKTFESYKYKKDKNFTKHDKWLYQEFLKALKIHTVDSLQNYYRDMQIRMRKLFNN